MAAGRMEEGSPPQMKSRVRNPVSREKELSGKGALKSLLLRGASARKADQWTFFRENGPTGPWWWQGEAVTGLVPHGTNPGLGSH